VVYLYISSIKAEHVPQGAALDANLTLINVCFRLHRCLGGFFFFFFFFFFPEPKGVGFEGIGNHYVHKHLFSLGLMVLSMAAPFQLELAFCFDFRQRSVFSLLLRIIYKTLCKKCSTSSTNISQEKNLQP